MRFEIFLGQLSDIVQFLMPISRPYVHAKLQAPLTNIYELFQGVIIWVEKRIECRQEGPSSQLAPEC